MKESEIFKILVVEDDREINQLLYKLLSKSGYQVTSAENGLDGLNHIKREQFDLVILDLMIPYKSGDELLRELRLISNTPAIILSAKGLVQTKIELLKLGADDYVTKPFDIDELLARVEANLRRGNTPPKKTESQEKLQYKDLVLDLEGAELMLGEAQVSLTVTEFKILKLLFSNQEKVFSKANLFESVWEETYYGDDNVLNVHMSNLRSKLGKLNPNEDYIETIWGIGYRLAKKKKED